MKIAIFIISVLLSPPVMGGMTSISPYLVRHTTNTWTKENTFQTKVAVATTTVSGSTLTVNGRVESLVGGFKFPDGTTQTTAASTPKNWNFVSYSGPQIDGGTGTTVFSTVTLPANTLDVNGDAVRIYVAGNSNAGGVLEIMFGGTQIGVMNDAISGGMGTITCVVTRASSNNQDYTCTTVGNSNANPVVATGTLTKTDSSTIDVTVKGTGAPAFTHTYLNAFTVEYP